MSAATETIKVTPSFSTITVIDGVGETVKILPMDDHYAVTASGEVVAVVCRVNADQWSVEAIVGRVPVPSSYIPLAHALKAAAEWRR